PFPPRRSSDRLDQQTSRRVSLFFVPAYPFVPALAGIALVPLTLQTPGQKESSFFLTVSSLYFIIAAYATPFLTHQGQAPVYNHLVLTKMSKCAHIYQRQICI